MLFNSMPFILIFLPAVLVVALRLRGAGLLRWICVSSFIFYMLADQPWFLIPMLVTTGLDYFLAIKLSETERVPLRRFWLAVSLIGNLGLLIFFKYTGFLLDSA